GNNYINRNTVGAVVGVNPFGGQGLSGTGPKAGGPNYMTRFSSEKIELIEPAADEKPVAIGGGEASTTNAIIGGEQVSQAGAEQVAQAMEMASNSYLGWDLARGDVRGLILDKAAELIQQRLPDQKAAASVCRYYAQQAREKCQAPTLLPGPTGETNELTLHGRGVFFCAVADGTAVSSFVQQVVAALAAGNGVISKPAGENALVAAEIVKALLDAGVPNELLHFVPGNLVTKLVTADFRTAGIAWTGPVDNALQMQLDMAERGGAIAPMVVEAGGPNYLVRFAVEKTTTVNIVATGGNALLLNLDE
ncbi:MAG: aldehyde dehydrogenase family protein, partial [Porticoccaceae bacterium]|nr:aldehyde dehydrogenase family protein [Porticoccaceae bacterium]